MQVLDVDTQINLNGVKAVVYGAAGVGKTRLALTVPKPIILSAEKGLLSLRGHRLPMLPEIKNLADLINAHNWLLNDKASMQYETIVVDSISEIAEVVLRNSKNANKDGRKAHDEASELVINNVFRSFRDMPRRHVVLIAKERSDLDEYTRITLHKPDMPNGKLRLALPHYFDFVFRYINTVDAQGAQWQGLQTLGNVSGVAKDRSGRLAPYELPHLGNIFAKAMS